MPLMFLWKVFIPISFKESTYKKAFWDEEIELYEHNRRDIIYSKIHLVNNINIDQQKIRNYENFWSFLNKIFENEEEIIQVQEKNWL